MPNSCDIYTSMGNNNELVHCLDWIAIDLTSATFSWFLDQIRFSIAQIM